MLNNHELPEPSLQVRVKGGALMFGMKASVIAGVSREVTLTDETGRFTLRLPLPEFDWIANGDVVFTSLGLVMPFIDGIGSATSAERTTEGGLIVPRN